MQFLKLLVSVAFFISLVSSNQQPDGIEITVRTGHKKITYVAENVTDKDLDLFFKVNSEGFRRSADRPIITTIPAKSKKDLITLIPLKNADTTHSYMAVITKKEFNVDMRKTDTIVKDIKRIDPAKKN